MGGVTRIRKSTAASLVVAAVLLTSCVSKGGSQEVTSGSPTFEGDPGILLPGSPEPSVFAVKPDKDAVSLQLADLQAQCLGDAGLLELVRSKRFREEEPSDKQNDLRSWIGESFSAISESLEDGQEERLFELVLAGVDDLIKESAVQPGSRAKVVSLKGDQVWLSMTDLQTLCLENGEVRELLMSRRFRAEGEANRRRELRRRMGKSFQPIARKLEPDRQKELFELVVRGVEGLLTERRFRNP